jgi:YNFM family putative membrane transporter
MAVAGIAVALFSRRVDRRRGIVLGLALLAIPTSLLAVAPNLLLFTALRVMQGFFMSAAFTLTLTYLAEQCSATDTAGAFAGYITGNVASNLFGRLMSAAIADHLGLAANFYVFALLNLAGALLVFSYLRHADTMMLPTTNSSPFAALRQHQLFLGGLVGSAVLGQVYDRLGWPACVDGIGLGLALAALLAFRLKLAAV